jgi:hypothetical protein
MGALIKSDKERENLNEERGAGLIDSTIVSPNN